MEFHGHFSYLLLQGGSLAEGLTPGRLVMPGVLQESIYLLDNGLGPPYLVLAVLCGIQGLCKGLQGLLPVLAYPTRGYCTGHNFPFRACRGEPVARPECSVRACLARLTCQTSWHATNSHI